MCRIRIKCEIRTQNLKEVLLRIFNNLQIKCSELVFNKDDSNELILWCNSDNDADKMFQPKCIESLIAHKCKAIMPPKLKANRSILLKKIDKSVYDHTVDEIKHEIKAKNPEFDALEVIKFPNSTIIKITFASCLMAEKCLRSGLKLFMFHLPPHYITKDEHLEIVMCYRCYSLNDHVARDCPKPAVYKICSNCCSTQHDYKSCNSLDKKCINCGGFHSSMSFSCPKRKEILKNLRKNSSSRTTYAQVTANGPKQNNMVPQHLVQPQHPDMNEVKSTLIKSLLCIVVAAEKEKEAVGSFANNLSLLQKTNGVPEFNFGNVEIPKSFLNLCDATGSPVVSPGSALCAGALDGSAMHAGESDGSPPSVSPGSAEFSAGDVSDIGAASSSVLASHDPVQDPNIKIIKKQSCPSLSTRNLAELFKSGWIKLESDDNLSGEQCLDFLNKKLSICRAAIANASTVKSITKRT